MEWKHKCSLDWLRERQKYLTATDIKSLIPVTKTGRPRKITDMDRLKVWAKKQVTLTEEDCWSYGAAARGHLLEPYAIDALNDWLIDTGRVSRQTFFHWDDEVIHEPGSYLAFSPDAMDIPQLHNYDAIVHQIAEVKCYSADKHVVTGYTPPNEIEERWQIATAMATLDTIEWAYLVLFNPSIDTCRLFVIPYSRNDLLAEIDAIRVVENEWNTFLDDLSDPLEAYVSLDGLDEAEIIDELERAQRLNP